MAVYRTLDEARIGLERPAVAIGNFDGVHGGHRYVFELLKSRAEDAGTDAAALTFEPHPVRFFRPDLPPFRLMTPEQKFERIQAFDVDVVALTFDSLLSGLTPAEFVEKVLHEGLNASRVVVGEDFVFGKGRSGDTRQLKSLCENLGIEVELLDPVESDAEVISSTRIRENLAVGHMEVVHELLGRPYTVRGRVIHGEARGRDLGFPTANVAPGNVALPPDGIYAAVLAAEGHGRMDAAAYIGSKPTFEGAGERSVEAFVLDREELDLYEKEVDLEFWHLVRRDRRFESSEALVAQMERDVAAIRSYFEENPHTEVEKDH